MNVAPINGEYFHVSHGKDYNAYDPLQVGSSTYIGAERNPFTQVYEQAREYRVNTPSGPDKVPALKFLREVKRGNIDCPDIAKQAYNIANYYNILARELILEEVRHNIAPNAPSRKTCLWVSDSFEMALTWRRKLSKSARVLKLQLEGTFHAADARLMMNESEPLADAYAKAERYWRSDTSENPLPEILFAGRATVLEDVTESS